MPDFSSTPDFMNDSVPAMTPNPGIETQPTNLASAPSPEFSKFKLNPKKTGVRFLVPLLLLAVVGVAVAAGMVLVSRSQDVRQQASGGPEYTCGSGDGLFSTLVPNSVPCLWEGAPYYRCKDGYKNENNGCVIGTVGTPNPSSGINTYSTPSPGSQSSCSSGSGLFADPVGNSHACTWLGANYYECNSGYHNENNDCRSNTTTIGTPNPSSSSTSFSTPNPSSNLIAYSTPNPSSPACTSVGLFNNSVANSHTCASGSTIYYECNSGYVYNGTSCSSATGSATCSSEDGLLMSSVAHSHACILNGFSFFECNSGYHNANYACVSNITTIGTPNPASYSTPSPFVSATYRIVGNAPSLSCEQCAIASECAYSASACQTQVNTLNSQQVCYGSGNCYIGIYKQSCGANEYGSTQDCLNATNQNITYRISGTPPNLSCQLCANPADCGFTLDACRVAKADLNSKIACYPAGNCSIGFLRDSCLTNEYLTQDACLAAGTAQTSGTGSLSGGSITGE